MEPIDHAHQHASTRSEEEWRNRLAAGTNASQHLPVVHASAPCCARAASQRGWCCIAFAPASVDFVMLRETKNDPTSSNPAVSCASSAHTPKGRHHFTLHPAVGGMPQGLIMANGQAALCATMCSDHKTTARIRFTPSRCNIQVATSPSIHHQTQGSSSSRRARSPMDPTSTRHNRAKPREEPRLHRDASRPLRTYGSVPSLFSTQP